MRTYRLGAVFLVLVASGCEAQSDVGCEPTGECAATDASGDSDAPSDSDAPGDGDACAANLVRVEGDCISQRELECAQASTYPANAEAVIAPVTIHYTDAAGWEATPTCSWRCTTGHQTSADSLGCDVIPQAESIILYSAGTSNGNLGGRAGADARCAAAAPTSVVTERQVALMSLGWDDEIRSFAFGFDVPLYVDVRSLNSTVIATSFADLLDGQIATSLSAAGVVGSETSLWWSGSEADGRFGDHNCGEFSNANFQGNVGSTAFTHSGWIHMRAEECDRDDVALLCLAFNGPACLPDTTLWGTTCISERKVACTPLTSTPDNARSNPEPKTIHYTDAAGWEPTPDCDFGCIAGYRRTADGQGCEVDPTTHEVILFSPGVYNGNLGGRAGADALCQQAIGNLPVSTAAAVLAPGATRMEQTHGLPYDAPVEGPTGVAISDEWASLTYRRSNVTLQAAAVTAADSWLWGDVFDCNDWTSASPTERLQLSSSGAWPYGFYTYGETTCDTQHALVCAGFTPYEREGCNSTYCCSSDDCAGLQTPTGATAECNTSTRQCNFVCPWGYGVQDGECKAQLPMYLYRTSARSGELGGRAGADALCAAAGGQLAVNRHVALLSTGPDDEIRDLPSTQGVPTDRRIFTKSGNIVALNWTTLFGQDLHKTLEENGVVAAGQHWWSGSTATGELAANNCSGFTSGTGTSTVGSGTATDSHWLDDGELACSASEVVVLCLGFDVQN